MTGLIIVFWVLQVCGGLFDVGNVEKNRQQRSRHFAVLTYSLYAPRVKMAAALLDGLF
jgi:hypothetical protein